MHTKTIHNDNDNDNDTMNAYHARQLSYYDADQRADLWTAYHQAHSSERQAHSFKRVKWADESKCEACDDDDDKTLCRDNRTKRRETSLEDECSIQSRIFEKESPSGLVDIIRDTVLKVLKEQEDADGILILANESTPGLVDIVLDTVLKVLKEDECYGQSNRSGNESPSGLVDIILDTTLEVLEEQIAELAVEPVEQKQSFAQGTFDNDTPPKRSDLNDYSLSELIEMDLSELLEMDGLDYSFMSGLLADDAARTKIQKEKTKRQRKTKSKRKACEAHGTFDDNETLQPPKKSKLDHRER